MSLRLRLTLLVAGLMSLLIALASTVRYLSAASDAGVEADSNLHLAFALLPAQASSATDLPILARLASLRHVRVEFHGADGRLVAASRQGEALELSRRLPLPGAYAWPAPLRKDLTVDGERAGHFLVVPDARDEVDEKWRELRRDIALIVAFAIVLGLVVFWAVSRALRPLERIHGALQSIQEGRLGTRLAPMRGGDLSAVTASFNAMATSLEGAVRERQQLLDKLLSMEERTRRMIAHDLHDELTPYLVAVRPHLSILESAARADPALKRFGPTLATVRGHLDATVTRIRHLLESLHPPELQGLTLAAALGELVRQQHAASARPVTIDLDVDVRLPRLAAPAESSVFRIVQESITNAFKHSDCSRVVIGLAVASGAVDADAGTSGRDVGAGNARLELDVWNDGNARDQGFGRSGFGVLGIRERVMALGGDVEAGFVATGGWRVRVSLPLELREETT